MWPLFKKYQLGESVIPQKYREMMMLAAAAAVKCPYCQTYHKEVSKMWDASNEELNEMAAVVALTAFWSNVLHTQNYDYDTFVKELKQMGEYMTKNMSQLFLFLGTIFFLKIVFRNKLTVSDKDLLKHFLHCFFARKKEELPHIISIMWRCD